jgi:hypothetical protein
MPMNKANYPVDWKAISRRIRERDGQKCKWCGIPNRSYYYREAGECVVLEADDREEAEMEAPVGARIRRVVLTVAHWPDANPMNCADDNLRSLCQSCHNRLDMPMRQAHAKVTRQHKRRAAVAAAGQLSF